jgi:CIC family chloride channel protein
VLKLGACVATVGLGASAGLGGPSQWLGARTGLYYVRALASFRALRGVQPTHALLVGAAAGVSAIFRAPLAGTLLALETPFARDMDGTALVPASLAAITASVVHGLLVDNRPLLPVPTACPSGARAVFGAVVIGVAAGLLSRRFQRVLAWTRRATGHLAWWQRSLAGGVVTSATGLAAAVFFGDTWTFQGGLPLAHALFEARFLGWMALSLMALKLASVWATFGTSGVAGLLVITLTMGTLLGASCQPLVPFLDPRTACAIGICAYLAANYNAPLTAIALAAEWGGTSLLALAWIPILVAAWIGEGLANTPGKAGRRHGRAIHHH